MPEMKARNIVIGTTENSPTRLKQWVGHLFNKLVSNQCHHGSSKMRQKMSYAGIGRAYPTFNCSCGFNAGLSGNKGLSFFSYFTCIHCDFKSIWSVAYIQSSLHSDKMNMFKLKSRPPYELASGINLKRFPSFSSFSHNALP